MNANTAKSGGAGSPFTPGLGTGVLAIWVPAKAKNKKRKVPTNSPRAATVLLRRVAGRVSMGSAPEDE